MDILRKSSLVILSVNHQFDLVDVSSGNNDIVLRLWTKQMDNYSCFFGLFQRPPFHYTHSIMYGCLLCSM